MSVADPSIRTDAGAPGNGGAAAPAGLGLDIGADTIKAMLVRGEAVEEVGCLAVQGKPFARVAELLEKLLAAGTARVRLGVTGSGALQVAAVLGVKAVDEPNAIVAACNLLYPQTRTVVEMGRETQKYLRLNYDEVAGRLLLDDANLSTKCAAGSGSFLDHMAKRLNYGTVEEFARVAYETENPATLSGRCAVFTESDIVHLYQKGTPRERIAAGIHQAICRNYRSAIARGKDFADQVIFIGGVSLNPAVRKYLAVELGLSPERILVPANSRMLGAVGGALRASVEVDLAELLAKVQAQMARPLEYPGTDPLRASKSVVLSPDDDLTDLPRNIPLAALGVDIGSVSTKAALVTEVGGKIRILAAYYRRTDGDPLSAVRDTVSRIQQQATEAGFIIGEIFAGTTGSGRYLTGDYIGADVIKNEITAQAQGARAFTPDIQSILEIGGQDSKYIKLDGDVIVDFEMNKACAAGTGAFLEKQAARLGLDLTEFGPTALRAKRPPDLDWNCTVFSESAAVYYQQNNVPIEELCAGLCLASVKNYLNKNVGSREIGAKAAFQGAVAFNQGMVAAFETVLGVPIVVPPYPHLTGAIGVATIAYRQRPARSRFRGFEQIARGEYKVSSFECRRCPNRCDVNVFELAGSPKYYYNDRCEHYSGAHKRGLGEGLPDLFAEREQMLLGETETRGDGPVVGIPRGFMFAEYYPLYREFFRHLGFRVLPSDPSNKEIVTKGINAVAGEPCFPIKVAHGHVAWLLEKHVDYLFMPGVCDTEQPNDNLRQSHTCPYVMSGPELIVAALHLDPAEPATRPAGESRKSKVESNGQRPFDRIESTSSGVRVASHGPALCGRSFPVPNNPVHLVNPIERPSGVPDSRLPGPKVLRPRLFFKRGEKHLRNVFRKLGKELGKKPNEVEAAIEAGLTALHSFRKQQEARGREVLASLGKDARAFVVIGRPYTAYDPAVNMDIGKKIQDMGILAIPQDFLPLESQDISDSWPNAYSRQIQKKLAAARLIARDPRLRAVVLTYFACGPDSFANPFFKDEIGEPCYVMQIDEHTADAGVITRMEAFADTAIGKNGDGPSALIRTNDTPVTALEGKRLWLPHACDGAKVLAGAMRAWGIDADVLPRSTDPGLNVARRMISEDVCLPMTITTQDILERVIAPDFEASKEAFFQGQSEGPCRFGMYYMLQKRLIDKLGLGEGSLVTLGARSADGGLGFHFLLTVWSGLVAHDLLEKLRMHTRPYEQVPGESDRIFDRYLNELVELIPTLRRAVESSALKIVTGRYTEPVEDLLRRAQRHFAALPRREETRPLVGLVGEFFVRLHDGSNQSIVRKLEGAGAEVWLAPMTEFFSYASCIGSVLSRERWADLRNFDDWKLSQGRAIYTGIAMRDEHHLFQATLPYLQNFDDIGPQEIIELGSRYVHPSFGGETICSMGKAVDFARRGLDGIVNVIPFNCMPGNAVTMLSQAFRRDHDNIPWLNLDYDGFVDAGRDAKIVSFLSQVKERRAARRERVRA